MDLRAPGLWERVAEEQSALNGADNEASRPTEIVRGGNAAPAIDVSRVSHWYGDGQAGVHALDDVSLAMRPGEFVTVVGPSGCGKSTLLRLIAGLEKPTAGQVRCFGESVVGPGPDRGVVFQNLALMPWRTVERNIAHGLEIAGVPREERHERVHDLIARIGLEGFERSYPHQLSGGMRQRVAVARTWAIDPPVILMDEPFGAVDAQTRISLQEELLSMTTASEKTVLFITHSVEEAVLLGDRVVVMSRRPGRIKEEVRVSFDRADRSIEQLVEDDTMQALQAQVMASVRDEVRGGNAP